MKIFDPEHDYFEDLKENEKYKDNNGREYPYLRGLQRLAHTNRGGVKEIRSEIVKAPSVNSIHKATSVKDGDQEIVDNDVSIPDCIAAVTVTYYFHDGTVFAGSADCSYKAVEAPINLHLTAVADSKAEARAIRRAFNISKVSKEEIGDPNNVSENRDNEPITDAQLMGIKKIAKRKELSQGKVLELIKSKKKAIGDLTRSEASAAMKAVNKYQKK